MDETNLYQWRGARQRPYNDLRKRQKPAGPERKHPGGGRIIVHSWAGRGA